MKWKSVTVGAATLIAVTLSWNWGFALRLWPFSVISGWDEPEVDVIRRVMPHHMVNPDRVRLPAGQDLTITWLLKETKVRMLTVWGSWAVLVAGVFMIRKKSSSRNSDASSKPAPETDSLSHEG